MQKMSGVGEVSSWTFRILYWGCDIQCSAWENSQSTWLESNIKNVLIDSMARYSKWNGNDSSKVELMLKK